MPLNQFDMFVKRSIKILIIFFTIISNFGINSLIVMASQELNSNKINVKKINSTDYIIGPGDILKINFDEIQDYSGNYKVLSDGSISIPYIGSFAINGYTIRESINLLTTELSKVLKSPYLNISILKKRPVKVSVIGEVNSPGLYTLGSQNNQSSIDTDSFYGLPTLVDAIRASGGISKTANIKDVILIRKTSNKTDYPYIKTKLNLISLILEGNQQNNPYLFDGDIIKINKAKDLNEENSFQIASANLNSKNITINLTGEVDSPGQITIPSNYTLTQGIMAGGGPKIKRFNKSQIWLLRVNENGTLTKKRYRLNLKRFNKKSEENPLLQNGDSILIKRNSLTATGDTLNTISNPITNIVSVWSLFKLIEGD